MKNKIRNKRICKSKKIKCKSNSAVHSDTNNHKNLIDINNFELEIAINIKANEHNTESNKLQDIMMESIFDEPFRMLKVCNID